MKNRLHEHFLLSIYSIRIPFISLLIVLKRNARRLKKGVEQIPEMSVSYLWQSAVHDYEAKFIGICIPPIVW
jgi:hypothetical protein